MIDAITYSELESCVDAVVARVGKHVVIGTPLGIGKPNVLLNAFFRRAQNDPSIQLKIMTALSLEKPVGHSDLERRFLEPFVARVFGDYPELEYMRSLRRGTLPLNIEISEFYFKSGSLLHNPIAQQHHTSTNYTHVARDMLASGVNVVVQMVSREVRPEGVRYSLSSNPDVTLDIMPGLREAERHGRKVVVVGLINPHLPFMYGDACVGPEFFDMLVDNPGYAHQLFAVPNMAIDPIEHMIGLYASTLIRDGGTLQVGIGNLGDAFVYSSQLRHGDNARYIEVLEQLAIPQKFGGAIALLGGTNAYQAGLYAGSEMFSDGLLRLYRSGILKRHVYDHEALQRLLNDGKVSESVNQETLSTLVAEGVISRILTATDMTFLQRFGIFKPDVVYDGGLLELPDGTRLVPDLANPHSLDLITTRALGSRLIGGVLLHGAFFLGSRWFYDALHAMPELERSQFSMTAVSRVNELFSDVKLEQRQHRHARFINTCMKMTVLGAAASDTLEEGQVVSGVGGQYNFVAMAHALREGRSLLLLKSTRYDAGKVLSNMVWEYGQCTIPRHLRDIVITEYGIADLRGKQDWEVIAALLCITDSRFQDTLLDQARRAGKMPADYHIPVQFRGNTPENLCGALKPFQRAGLFPEFPFGSDFTPEELVLGKAMLSLKRETSHWMGRLSALGHLVCTSITDPRYAPYLKRLGLSAPKKFRDLINAKLVVRALMHLPKSE